jgi:hypothetical protein
MVDYVVGRVNGKYLPSNPALFRHRRGFNKGSGPISSETLFDSRSSAYANARNDGKEAHNRSNPTQENYHNLADNGPSSQDSVQQQNNSSSTDPIEQFHEATTKMAELKREARKHLPDHQVKRILRDTSRLCMIRGNNKPIDLALKSIGKANEFKEAQDYLNGP